MSATKPIPKNLREEMAADPFYSKCCIADSECAGRIEWHHNLIYANQRQNEKFCILPVCHFHHEHEARRDIKVRLNVVMYNRATPEDLAKFPRRNFKV